MENESNTKIISLKFKVKVAAFMILIIILISNIPLVTWFIDGISGNDYYAYSTGDGYCTLWCGSFKEYPYPNYMTLSTTKIDSTHDGEIIPVGKELRNLYPNADTVFYRLFWKNPFKFWHLYELFFQNQI